MKGFIRRIIAFRLFKSDLQKKLESNSGLFNSKVRSKKEKNLRRTLFNLLNPVNYGKDIELLLEEMETKRSHGISFEVKQKMEDVLANLSVKVRVSSKTTTMGRFTRDDRGFFNAVFKKKTRCFR